MNHYPHHIGDYDSDTSHLDWLEDMAYTRLLRLYYRTEKPIPPEVKEACRLVRAKSKQEKAAVDSALREFFVLEADGWHNKRADEELAAYREKSAKAAKSASVRWGVKHTERNANASHDDDANAMRAHSEGNANQNQNQNQNQQTHSAGVLAKAIREAGIGSVNPGDPRLLALVEVGATPEEMRSAASEATAKGKGFAYALAIAEGRRKDASRLASLPTVEKTPEVFT